MSESYELREGSRLYYAEDDNSFFVEKYRSRLFVAVLYPEDPTHAECMEKLESNGYNYAAILHDKDLQNDEDETKKAHWHIIVRFKNAVWNTAVAKDLGIKVNYLEACKDQDASLLYLVHHGKEEKHQYDLEEVFGPMRLKLATLLADTDEGTRVLNICQIIEETPGPIGYSELLKKAVAAGLYADLRRMGQFAIGIMREHNFEYTQTNQKNSGVMVSREAFNDYLTWTGNKDVKPL